MSTVNQIKILDKVSHEYLVANIGVDANNITNLTLNKISDVNITNPTNNQILVFNNNSWVNEDYSNEDYGLTVVNGLLCCKYYDNSN